ncbi:MAG: hypothetical protein ACKO2G_04500 [Verrucomicrobiales bacterium]
MNTRTFTRILVAKALLLSIGQAEDKAIPYDLLAVHKTEATFKGTRQHKCLGRTSLCPDQCGHSGTMVTFTIDKYTDYQKAGEYGDPKQKDFQFLIEDNKKNEKVPANLLAKINALKPGDKVILEWEHRYMNHDGSRYPERPVTKLEKMP